MCPRLVLIYGTFTRPTGSANQRLHCTPCQRIEYNTRRQPRIATKIHALPPCRQPIMAASTSLQSCFPNMSTLCDTIVLLWCHTACAYRTTLPLMASCRRRCPHLQTAVTSIGLDSKTCRCVHDHCLGTRPPLPAVAVAGVSLQHSVAARYALQS
jgi:hypothetical protein